MADAFTQLSALSSDTAAYEALSYFALRPELYFDAVADVKPTNQTHRGSSVTFFQYADIAAQTTPISETADPDAVGASDATVVVTPDEYGLVVKSTAQLRATSLLDVSEDLANLVGYNAGLTIDTLASDVLDGGTNVIWATGGATTPTSQATIDADDTLTVTDMRQVVAGLRGANVKPKTGNKYWGFIHPDVSFYVMNTTGTNGWTDPHAYSAPENIWSGEIGSIAGVRWVETPRAPIVTDGGASAVDAYLTLVCGSQAIALGHYNAAGYGPAHFGYFFPDCKRRGSSNSRS